MKYVFYDTETTGTDTTFDQILQFAAILTDADLNELDRFETRCRLLPHVIPSLGALLATRVTPAMLSNRPRPSKAFAKTIFWWSVAENVAIRTLDLTKRVKLQDVRALRKID